MGIVHIMERGGEDYRDYKRALKMAKKSIDILCDLTEEMEDEYGYSKREGHLDDDEFPERRITKRSYR